MSRGKDVVVEEPALIDHCKQRSNKEWKKGRIVTLLCRAGGDRKVQEDRYRWGFCGSECQATLLKIQLVRPLNFPSAFVFNGWEAATRLSRLELSLYVSVGLRNAERTCQAAEHFWW